MDIEALRKINMLTKELQKHGITSSSEEALKQAEHILQPLQETQKITPTNTTQNESASQETSSDALLERKYKMLLEINNKKFEKEIDTLQNSMNELIKEINKLKTEINTIGEKKTIVETKPQQQETFIQEQTPTNTQKKESHPRQGNFAPGDISIEKMFYFGNK